MPLSLDELKKWAPDPERLNLESLNQKMNAARWELHVNTLRVLFDLAGETDEYRKNCFLFLSLGEKHGLGKRRPQRNDETFEAYVKTLSVHFTK